MATRLNVNRSTVTEFAKPLLAARILREDAFQTSASIPRSQGRPPIGLSFVDNRDCFVGINLGVRRSQIGFATLSGETLAEEEFETPEKVPSALELTRATIVKLGSRIADRKIKTIGVSVPGVADASHCKLIFAPHLIQGKSNSEIARLSCISLLTMKKHCKNIYQKLGVKSRLAATSLAVQSFSSQF